MRAKTTSDGPDAILNTPAEFARFLKAEREPWSSIARNIGFERDK